MDLCVAPHYPNLMQKVMEVLHIPSGLFFLGPYFKSDLWMGKICLKTWCISQLFSSGLSRAGLSALLEWCEGRVAPSWLQRARTHHGTRTACNSLCGLADEENYCTSSQPKNCSDKTHIRNVFKSPNVQKIQNISLYQMLAECWNVADGCVWNFISISF